MTFITIVNKVVSCRLKTLIIALCKCYYYTVDTDNDYLAMVLASHDQS